MQRGFTIQSKVDGLMLDGLVVEPADGASAAQPWNERIQGAVSAVYGVYGGTRCSVCDS